MPLANCAPDGARGSASRARQRRHGLPGVCHQAPGSDGFVEQSKPPWQGSDSRRPLRKRATMSSRQANPAPRSCVATRRAAGPTRRALLAFSRWRIASTSGCADRESVRRSGPGHEGHTYRRAPSKIHRHPAHNVEISGADERLPAISLQLARQAIKPFADLPVDERDIQRRITPERADKAAVMRDRAAGPDLETRA